MRRHDIEGPADLVEEVVRIHGLDKVESVALPRMDGVARPTATPQQMMERKIMNHCPKDERVKAFSVLEEDESGKITFKSLKQMAKESKEPWTDEELQEMIDLADKDGDGAVSQEEFFRVLEMKQR